MSETSESAAATANDASSSNAAAAPAAPVAAATDVIDKADDDHSSKAAADNPPPPPSSKPSSASTSKERTKSKGTKQLANGTSSSSGGVRYNRIFKKSSQDGNLVLFLPHRELMVTETRVEPLIGVALVHESLLQTKAVKVYLQVVLMFRYGREDEELMGLRFCNEIVIAAEQLHPPMSAAAAATAAAAAAVAAAETATAKGKEDKKKKKKEEAKENDKKEEGEGGQKECGEERPAKKFQSNEDGFVALPFAMDMGASAPPSVRLLPCRPYNGAPIGTTYEVQLFAGKTPEDLPKRRKMVQMSLRLFERLPKDLPPRAVVTVEKNYVFSENNLLVQARLDAGVYAESDVAHVALTVRRPGGHGVRRIKVTAVQQVGVAMFSTGNFKNVVGIAGSGGDTGGDNDSKGDKKADGGKETLYQELDPTDSCYRATIPVKIALGGRGDYSWVAMDETAKRDADIRHLAPTVVHASKAMFIIRVHYYVQVRLWFGVLRKALSLKLPFLLRRSHAAEQQLMAAFEQKTPQPQPQPPASSKDQKAAEKQSSSTK